MRDLGSGHREYPVAVVLAGPCAIPATAAVTDGLTEIARPDRPGSRAHGTIAADPAAATTIGPSST